MSGIARGTYPVILKAAGASTSSTTGSATPIPPGFTRVRFVVNCTARSGTSPTLNVYIQNAITFPAAADAVASVMTGTQTWNDFISFAQITAAATQYASLVESTNFINAAQDAALAAGTIRAGAVGSWVRVKWVIGGSNPSFTFSVFAEFLS